MKNVIFKCIETKGMKIISLAVGYALIPDRPDWITLNNPTIDSKYVGVVEVRNPRDGSKDYQAKHYVVFSNDSIYSINSFNEILDKICSIDPDFEKIRNDVVEPEFCDPTNHSLANMTNKDAWLSAPQIGLFVLDTVRASDYRATDYPYGCAVIINADTAQGRTL